MVKVFSCSENNLTSLEHCPREVGGAFDFSHNNIGVVDSWPEHIGGLVWCGYNPIKSIKEGVVPLKHLLEFYKEDIGITIELLMKELDINTEEELEKIFSR